uniref:Uncharacterized protein n=1 Tax=Cacopsylla melanoneura TaxID=428564 RepID=A0A8D8VJP5_9HEMI
MSESNPWEKQDSFGNCGSYELFEIKVCPQYTLASGKFCGALSGFYQYNSRILISNEITLLPDVLSFPLRNVFGKQSKITFGEFLSYTFLMIRRPQRSTLFPYRRSSDLSFSSISVVWRWGWGVVFRTKGR